MNQYLAVGLLSGTSLDGVDAALCRIALPEDEDDPLTETTIDIEAFRTETYGASFRSTLESCCAGEASPETVARTSIAVADRFARATMRLLEEASVAPEEVDVIGSHGQTIWHAPTPKPVPGTDRRSRVTVQIGDGAVVARETRIDTVADFRAADVAAGGHGAPLSPLFDWIQFGDESEDRIVQNIGGIGNCTILPRGGDRSAVTAFDTGPGNMVIDAVVQSLTDGERRYDEDGALAAAGTVDETLLAELLEDPFFDRKPPKSTGRERFGRDYAVRVLERARVRGLEDADIVATVTALTSASIVDAYDRHTSVDPDRVILSGGGAWNGTLVSMLDDALSCPVQPSRDRGIDPDSREAALFALLGTLFDAGRTGNVPTVTGASHQVVLGKHTKA